MKIAVAKEIKSHEYRVAITPQGVAALTALGHQVTVEHNAGVGSGITNDAYMAAGACIEQDNQRLFGDAELIVKVKEPQPQEVELLQPGQLLFTYLHLAALPELTRQLMNKKVSALGYETVTRPHGGLPLLHPMSLIAGRMAPQIGANLLQKEHGGRGVLLSGAPGVERGNVVILGAGTVGENALNITVGMGADVMIFDRSPHRLEKLDQQYGNRIQTLLAASDQVAAAVRQADLVIGAVLIAGAKAPQLVSAELVDEMKPGSVIVDVSIDQGGCVETIHPTSHDNPSYIHAGVVHYAVTNIPGAVARTSTLALTSRTLPYVIKLANLGLKKACETDVALLQGLNVHQGMLCNKAVATAHQMEAITPQQALFGHALSAES
ncbi:MAG: alanine dehydrogenase [Desulfuromonas sp.]|nr:alanine dehydrogenase [Desulfuromonas sp.]